MIEAFPEKYFHASAKDNAFYPIFESYTVDRDGLKFKHGEDYSFCYKWISIGGKVWIDPEIKMGHIGIKVFEGHLGNYLRNR